MDFTFDNNIPIYIQLLEYMKIYLISGVFKCGDKFPSVREFANTFKVNPNTMQKALSELESLRQPCFKQVSQHYFSNSVCYYFMSLCHILVILTIFQTFSSSLYLLRSPVIDGL